MTIHWSSYSPSSAVLIAANCKTGAVAFWTRTNFRHVPLDNMFIAATIAETQFLRSSTLFKINHKIAIHPIVFLRLIDDPLRLFFVQQQIAAEKTVVVRFDDVRQAVLGQNGFFSLVNQVQMTIDVVDRTFTITEIDQILSNRFPTTDRFVRRTFATAVGANRLER
uniref:Uncharacterized protein n=1 Tax=Romanomermis culicivorax TaxID=13658 RepID=A0A915JP95_ROMCU